MSLARLWRDQGKVQDAGARPGAALAGVVELSFSPASGWFWDHGATVPGKSGGPSRGPFPEYRMA